METSNQHASSMSGSVHKDLDNEIHSVPAAWGRHRTESARERNGGIQSEHLQRERSASPCSSQGSTTLTGRFQHTASDIRTVSPLEKCIASGRQGGHTSLGNPDPIEPSERDKSSRQHRGPSKSGKAAERRDTSAGRPPR